MGAGAILIEIEKAFKNRTKSTHKLKVYTADFGYDGDDSFDVSLQGGHYVLTPPKHLLMDYKFGRIHQDVFQNDYFSFLENSYVQNQHTWDDLLDKKKIILVCSCNVDDKTCHRYFLIKFLRKFGVVYKGKLKI